jgi:CubicO group peptidase (beta-lactamase class C family)
LAIQLPPDLFGISICGLRRAYENHPLQQDEYLSCPCFLLLLILPNANANITEKVFPYAELPISSPGAQGMRSHVLAEMMGHIKNKSLHIDSLAIVRNGHMVLDAYLYPFTKAYQHNIYSCTKSVMSALIGIAIDKGYIQDVNQPITGL